MDNGQHSRMLSTLGVLATEKEKEFKKFEGVQEFKEKETGPRGPNARGAIPVCRGRFWWSEAPKSQLPVRGAADGFV